MLFTILLFLVFSYVTWNVNVKKSFSLVAEASNKLAHNMDLFLNDIVQGSYQIPLYQKGSLTCKEDFIPYLEHIVINHPQISGLAIREPTTQIICSTLPDNKSFLLSQSHHRFIGPLTSAMFDYPVYAIQQQTGNYQLELIILASVLKEILNAPEYGPHITTLYDVKHKKKIVEIETKNNLWFDKFFIDSSFTHEKISSTTQLSNLNGVVVTVSLSNQTVAAHLLYYQILLSLDILVLSFFLYFLIKSIFKKYYSLHGAIKNALYAGQFYPVYQPLFDAHCNSYSGAEVLLRWQDNHDEIIMPDLFIEEAENTGLIVPITLQIIEIAFKETKTILHAQPTFHLAFNICALHFTDSHFFSRFYKLVKHYSIAPNQILLEITERYLLDINDEIYINRMHELRQLGYSLAIDDYGTGHSSISYLQYYPFNYLKIDKLFIHSIGTKAITESLNDAIIHLAKKINLIIIAEGVETKEQLNYLLQHNVHFLQGWYFSKALHVEELVRLLQGEKNE
ncbi:EAL domain-containing protein [Fluoribacter dumoffii]|uniref:Phage resistance protein n=1 Tax=Fluoribacter dumoffii TaxID=463 RepID=A0A377GAM5_9GAMM|nr:EAL domain-containing protein [Fluoribacter dumoffii]KTC93517.1 regulatory protein (EAL domain) [Fluoribacter dumoffii NY 23]MCW8418745.1 EAL domain-containing protein [Fluoribacter dumoffii]MCW8453411.1 EAL domain-containing protein [Fluoribacter dumoffii]MCW8459369.1 EAL domain-containing protein [Fluoribacter dumoffii]MCW8482728.1 EAL domain-containing protein [Fluoribacter dumoffii]